MRVKDHALGPCHSHIPILSDLSVLVACTHKSMLAYTASLCPYKDSAVNFIVVSVLHSPVTLTMPNSK